MFVSRLSISPVIRLSVRPDASSRIASEDQIEEGYPAALVV